MDLMLQMLKDTSNLDNFIKSNPLFLLLGDFGGTITPVMAAVKNLSLDNYLFGISYFFAFIRVIPSIHRLFPESFSTFVYLFPKAEQRSLGGSLIGEAYANFGMLGFLVMLLMGIVISKLYSYELKGKMSRFTIILLGLYCVFSIAEFGSRIFQECCLSKFLGICHI